MTEIDNRFSYIHLMAEDGIVSTMRELPNGVEREGWHNLDALTPATQQRLLRLFDSPAWTFVGEAKVGDKVRSNER